MTPLHFLWIQDKHPTRKTAFLFTPVEKDFNSILDQSFTKYDHMCIIGDLNYDLLSPEKSKVLNNICDSFSFTNLIKEATCFTKNGSPSLIDVIVVKLGSYQLGWPCNCVSLVVAHGRRQTQRFSARCIFCVLLVLFSIYDYSHGHHTV